MCKAPVTIFRNKKRDLVPCGKCYFCLQKKRADWSFRLLQELKVSSSAHFLTLTYDEQTIPSEGLRKRDLQLFFKSLRKSNTQKIRYYAVGEYGTRTHRPHYHVILFNCESSSKIVDTWPHGFVKVGTVKPESIHYVTKYVINRHVKFPGRAPPFALMSRRPGIGLNYLTEPMMKWHREDDRMYVVSGGFKQALPRYYRDKIFTPFERSLIQFGASHESEKEYLQEIERLIKAGYENPYHFYVERVRRNEELMMARLNKDDVF